MKASLLRNPFTRLNSKLIIFAVWLGCAACTATATSTKNITSASILDKVKRGEPVLVENMTIEEDLDFTKLPTYPETQTVRRVAIASPIFFKNCTFTGRVTTFQQDTAKTVLCDFEKNLSFLNCKFNNEVNFQGISVAGAVHFTKSQFNRAASFENAHFNAEAFFDETLFAQQARFQQTCFQRRATFWHSVWAGITYFQGSIFREDTQFNLSDFRGNLDFTLCTTDGAIHFNYAQLTGRSRFNNCHFRDFVDFNNSSLSEISLKEVVFERNVSFLDVQSGSISFENAIFQVQKPAIKLVNPSPNALNMTGSKLFLAQPILLK